MSDELFTSLLPNAKTCIRSQWGTERIASCELRENPLRDPDNGLGLFSVIVRTAMDTIVAVATPPGRSAIGIIRPGGVATATMVSIAVQHLRVAVRLASFDSVGRTPSIS